MRRIAGIVLACFGSAIVALVVAVVLAGISQSGVINMQITHVLFWIAFAISVTAVTLGVLLLSQSLRSSLLALVGTVILVGGGLWWLGSWLGARKAEQDAGNQPPKPIYKAAPLPPNIPITKTPPAPRPQQDNSVQIGEGAKVEQESKGWCSPNIIGGSSTVNCNTPPERKTGLELTVSLVDPIAPNIVVENQTDDLAEGITWELVMFRTTDQALFSYATQTIGYVKPHSKSARYAMSLNTLVQAPGGGGQIANGEGLIGTMSVDCPSCRGTTLMVSFVWGSSGWFYKVPDGNGRLMLPKDLSKSTVSQFIDLMNRNIGLMARTPIP